jgi:hypothetical protein
MRAREYAALLKRVRKDMAARSLDLPTVVSAVCSVCAFEIERDRERRRASAGRREKKGAKL